MSSAIPASEGALDLNADLGEERGDDVALLDIVTSANVATGAHAGGGAVLAEVARAAVVRGVALGAHPSYRDRAGFGRASLLASLREDAGARSAFIADLTAQILDVAAEAEAAGGRLGHVKAHGSLYNEAVADRFAAALVLDAVAGAQARYGRSLAIVTQPGGELASSAAAAGFALILEGFVDRAYDPAGRLVPRTRPGAVHHDRDVMVRQALDLARGRIRTADGTVLTIAVSSLCVHGDTPGAVAAARSVRRALEDHGWLISAAGAGGLAAGARGRVGRTGSPTGQRGSVRSAPPHPGAEGEAAMRVLPFGDRAWLVERVDEAPRAWVLEVADRAARAWPQSLVVPGLASLLIVRTVTWDGGGRLSAGVVPSAPGQWPRTAEQVRAGLAASTAEAQGDPAGQRTHVVPARYDGPDLVDAAEQAGLTAAELVARHVRAEWTVAAVGFSPGFGYLISPDPVFAAVMRRTDPRPRVPAGTIALAAGMCAVYPSATPGGWQLVGSTDAVLWDPGADPPAALRVGDRIRFEAA